MKKFKEFCRRHKTALIVIGSVAGAVVVYAITRKHYDKLLRPFKGKSAIIWEPNGSVINLERVKELLDLNADTAAQFAIFREGPDPKDYICILTDNIDAFVDVVKES